MMTRLALTLLLTWVSLCHSVVAWEADKDVRLHREFSFPTEENDTTVILLTSIVGGGFAELRTAVFDIVWSDT